MKTGKNLSRRQINKKMGIAACLGLVTPALAFGKAVTPAQVEGPFHPITPQTDTDMDLTLVEGHTESAQGEQILVRGRVLDTRGRPLKNALVDVWQANALGRYSHPKDRNTAPLDPNFQGWGLIRTDANGHYGFKTIKPGAYPLSVADKEGWRCRHIHFKVSRPGSRELITQMYFHGDPLIADDQQVAKVPEELQHLLIIKSVTDEQSGLPLFSFDLTLASLD